jgi:hypothetical protein
VLGGTTVTNAGSTTVEGNLGVDPGLAVTGFPPGLVAGGTIHGGDAVALQAKSDTTTAYNALAGEVPTVDLTGQDLGGKTLTRGVYHYSSSAQLTGALTLNAEGNPNAVFVFQIGSTLTTASNSSVLVINGGQDCNVFWQVGSSATLGTTTAFKGNILALTSITLDTGATVSGRALARNGAVTMDTNHVSILMCATLADAGVEAESGSGSGSGSNSGSGSDSSGSGSGSSLGSGSSSASPILDEGGTDACTPDGGSGSNSGNSSGSNSGSGSGSNSGSGSDSSGSGSGSSLGSGSSSGGPILDAGGTDACDGGTAVGTPSVQETGTASAACSTATVDNGWITGDLGPNAGAFFTVDLDAIPGILGDGNHSTMMSDALFGLSNGLASHDTDLAAIARFNPAGTIDVRNGGSYDTDPGYLSYNAADGTYVPGFAYLSGVTQHLRFDVNTVTHTYSVSDWGSHIATSFAFRTEQATASVLDHFALKVDAAGPLGVCNVTVQPRQCRAAISGGGFVNSAFTPQVAAFAATFTATPAANGIDGVVGLSAGPAGALSDLAAAIRFNPDGTINVRNGNGYSGQSPAYVAGKAYAFTLTVDMLAHTYSVNVNGSLIAYHYVFRSEQSSVSSLANLAVIADSTTAPVTVCDFAATEAPPLTVTACQSYLDCGSGNGFVQCSSDQICRQSCDCADCCPPGLVCGGGTYSNLPPAARRPPGLRGGTCI